MSPTKNTETPVPEIIGRKELGLRLGVHPYTIMRWDKEGKIKSFRVCGRVKYMWTEVLSEFQKTPGFRGR